jgi:hypothetical protein
MEVYTIEYHSSPTKPLSESASSGRKRKIEPSPQKKILAYSRAQISTQSRVLKEPLSSSPLSKKAKKDSHEKEGKPRHWIVLHDSTTNSPPVAVVETNDLSIVTRATFSSRHIDVGFTIFNEKSPNDLAFLSNDQSKTLFDLFAGNAVELMYEPPLLLFRVKTLPPRPWPLTIAGAPIRFTTSQIATGIVRGWSSLGKPKLDREDNRIFSHDFDILNEVLDYFTEIQVKVFEARLFSGTLFIIVVADDTDKKILPRTLFRVLVGYEFRSQVPAVTLSALRVIQPKGIVHDNTRYDLNGGILRPGVMVSSSQWQSQSDSGENTDYWNAVTLGICVQKNGQRFITVPTHLFKDAPSGEVFHPDPNGVVIGDRVHDLLDTGITLICLRHGFNFENVTFDDSFNGERITEVTGLLQNSPGVRVVRRGDLCYMDTPQTGVSAGVVRGIAIIQNSPVERIHHKWVDFENPPAENSLELPNGVGGAPILDGDGVVLGFYHFLVVEGNDAGTSVIVSTTELTKAGYTLG